MDISELCDRIVSINQGQMLVNFIDVQDLDSEQEHFMGLEIELLLKDPANEYVFFSELGYFKYCNKENDKGFYFSLNKIINYNFSFEYIKVKYQDLNILYISDDNKLIWDEGDLILNAKMLYNFASQRERLDIVQNCYQLGEDVSIKTTEIVIDAEQIEDLSIEYIVEKNYYLLNSSLGRLELHFAANKPRNYRLRVINAC